MKVVALIQARMNSTRLPKKIMMDIKSNPMIYYLISRLKLSKKINQIVLATTENSLDDNLVEFVSSIGVDIFRGRENNVLDRFYNAAKKFKADIVIRITADCPLIDPYLVDKMIEDFNPRDDDYLSNALIPSFPDGLDCEIFSFEALEKAWKEAKKPHELEHVTPYIYESEKFKIRNYKFHQDLSHHRWTVDEELDYLVIKNIFEYFHPKINFDFKEILNLFELKPNLFKHNKHI